MKFHELENCLKCGSKNLGYGWKDEIKLREEEPSFTVKCKDCGKEHEVEVYKDKCFSCGREFWAVSWFLPSGCPHCRRTFID